MRPPSYYSSLANSQPNRGSTNSSLQLRSSFSSPSSSSYATRNHLPFVSQSMLVAHCYTGTTRPYGSHSTGGSTSAGSYNNSYSRPRSTKQLGNPYLAAPSYSSSSSAYSSYSSPSSSSRYLSGAGSSLSSTFRPASSSYRSSYTPSASSYYKPIRLRERPLLNQISRQINSAEPPSAKHSESVARQAEPARQSPANRDQADESWQSDVARNISRNKYLIKFREIDKRPSPTPIQLTNRVEKPKPEESKVERPAQHETKAEKVEERAKEETVSKSMKVPVVVPALVERLEEKPSPTRSPRSIEDSPERPKFLPQIRSSIGKQAECESRANHQTAPAAPSEAELSPEASKSVKKKVPREKKNIKLKIKSLNKSNQEAEGERRTTSKAKKAASPDVSPNDTSPTVKTKVKRVVKTSKQGEENQAASGEAKSSLKVKTSEKTRKSTETQKTDLPRPAEIADPVEKRPTAVTNNKLTLSEASKLNKVETRQSKQEPVEQEKPALASPEAGANTNRRIRFREYHIEDFNFLSVLGHGGWGFVSSRTIEASK